MSRLLIIEPNLRSLSNHYAEFVRAVGMRAGDNVIDVMAHPDADPILSEMRGVRVWTKEPRVGRPLAEWRTIYNAVGKSVPFLVLTADGRHAAAVSLAAALTKQRPEHARLYFHKTPSGGRDRFFSAFSGAAQKYALALAPTEVIAGSLRAAGWRRVECVPYPALGPAQIPGPAPFARVLMAGVARMNKGLDLIVDLAKLWARQERDIPLFVQVSKKHAMKHGHREVAMVGSLLSSGYSALVTDERAPGRAEYGERFRGSLVLAPYERSRFAEQVSGVVLDALLHGAPVIATRGTWPGAQIDRFGAGITIEERTPEALAAAIDQVLGNWQAYSSRACEAARTLAREHDPHRLLTLIMEK